MGKLSAFEEVPGMDTVATDTPETSLPVMKLFVRAISVEFPKKATSEPETVVENWKQVCDERGWHNGWGRHQASSRNQMDEFNKLSVEEKAISIVGDFRIRKEEGNSYIVYDRFSGGVFGVNSVAAELIERIKAGNPSSEDINTVLKMLRQYYDEL